MISYREKIKKYAATIKKQKQEIILLKKEVQELGELNYLRLFEDLNAITGEYDTYMNANIEIEGSFERNHELFQTKLSNIVSFFSYNLNGNGNLTKIILIEPCESKIGTFRVTNEITYRINLQKLYNKIDKQQLHFAQISRSAFLNVSHFELYNQKGETIAKSAISGIKKEYSKSIVSENYIKFFNGVKERYNRILSIKNKIDKRISIQKKQV